MLAYGPKVRQKKKKRRREREKLRFYFKDWGFDIRVSVFFIEPQRLQLCFFPTLVEEQEMATTTAMY